MPLTQLPNSQLDRRCADLFQLARDWHYIYTEFFCNLFLTLRWFISHKRSFCRSQHFKNFFFFRNITREIGYATLISPSEFLPCRFVFVNRNYGERIH